MMLFALGMVAGVICAGVVALGVALRFLAAWRGPWGV